MTSFFSRLSWRRWIVLAPLLLIVILLGLFVLNGLWLARGETPLVARTKHPALKELAPRTSTRDAPRVKIMAYNIAKGFVQDDGGISFVGTEEVTARMEEIAKTIHAEQPDLVFLAEAILDCGPTPVNQVGFLAEKTGMASWGFGENFNIGLPGYRVSCGNAILCKAELVPVANPSLAGRRPFYVTKNNRRVLFCRTRIAGQNVLLGAIHTDSFNLENNLTQTRQILDFSPDEPTILAGDFNCRPTEPSIPLVMASGRFVGSVEDVGTFPAHQPEQTIDFIFAPAGWKLIDHRVLESNASDHRPIVATFEIPEFSNVGMSE